MWPAFAGGSLETQNPRRLALAGVRLVVRFSSNPAGAYVREGYYDEHEGPRADRALADREVGGSG